MRRDIVLGKESALLINLNKNGATVLFHGPFKWAIILSLSSEMLVKVVSSIFIFKIVLA